MRFVRALPLLLVLLAGCAAEREAVRPPAEGAAQAAEVDWAEAEGVDVTLSDFAFTPDRLVFEHGRPYRLHLEDRGSGGHNFAAPAFFRTVALREDPEAAELQEEGGVIELAKGEAKDVYLMPLQVGTFPLECTHFLHSTFGMTGEIVVQ